jgi:predicted aldo/keto reductase-like oxidoreductase
MEACVRRAFDLGINHFETARGYGTSEMQLGRVLPSLPRERILVQTKVSPQPTQKEFLDRFQASLTNLGLEYVDFLALHGINNRELFDRALKRNGCLEAARALQKEGRVRFVGFSTHASTDLIVKTINSGQFDYVNLHWYFVNPLNWPAVEAARKLDMGVLIISPNDKGGMLHTPSAKMIELCRPLTPMQFNDLFCLRQPHVHTITCGVRQPSDFDDHVQALEHYGRIEQAIAPIEARLRAEMERVMGRDWCARWTENLLPYAELPGEVNVAEILRLWTYGKSLDLREWARSRYNMLGQGDHWMPGAHAGCFEAERLVRTLAHHPFAEQLPGILREAHAMLYEPAAKN